MNTRDERSGTYQVELLNGGFRGRNRDNFYSFGIYNEGDAIGYWFKDYAILAFEGNADQLGRKFDLGIKNSWRDAQCVSFRTKQKSKWGPYPWREGKNIL